MAKPMWLIYSTQIGLVIVTSLVMDGLTPQMDSSHNGGEEMGHGQAVIVIYKTWTIKLKSVRLNNANPLVC